MSLEQHLSKYCARLVCKDVSKTKNAKQDIHVHVNEIKTLEKNFVLLKSGKRTINLLLLCIILNIHYWSNDKAKLFSVYEEMKLKIADL